jgi:hypothetical protein
MSTQLVSHHPAERVYSHTISALRQAVQSQNSSLSTKPLDISRCSIAVSNEVSYHTLRSNDSEALVFEHRVDARCCSETHHRTTDGRRQYHFTRR